MQRPSSRTPSAAPGGKGDGGKGKGKKGKEGKPDATPAAKAKAKAKAEADKAAKAKAKAKGKAGGSQPPKGGGKGKPPWCIPFLKTGKCPQNGKCGLAHLPADAVKAMESAYGPGAANMHQST